VSVQIQFRRGTAASWASANPVLAEGELGVVLDTGRYKIGDGVTPWLSLPQHELSPDVIALTMTGTTDPGSVDPGTMVFFARSVAGRFLPRVIGPALQATFLQPFLARSAVRMLKPPGNATTAPTLLGYTAHTVVGTATARNVATTNVFTEAQRLGYVSAATAASLSSQRVAVAQVRVGDGAGRGGFFKICRWGISDAALVATARTFVGVTSATGAPTNVEPSTLTNSIGMGHGASDTTMRVYRGGSAAQSPIDLGANFPCNTVNTDLYEFALFAPPNSSDVYYEVTRLNTGHVATGLLLNSGGVALPSSATLLSYHVSWRSNNATAAAVGIDLVSDYVETDN
jgi:hypothetical protein